MQEKQVYIARQPIVDINKNIISYELLFRHNATTEIAEFSDDLEASSNVMVNTLTALGSSWLDNKKAFINVSTSMIDTGLLELLPESNFILEIDEASQQMPNVNEKIMAVKDKGFEISLDDFVPTENAIAILQKAQYIKLDVLNNKKEVIERIVKIANKYDIHPIAKKVETNEMFEWAKKIGFKSFQGFFFAKPETLKTTVLNPAYEIILTIMNKVRQGAELKELEDWFKKDPGLSYKLFRYINSAGFGLTCEIQSLKHAITVLGVKPLYKWLTLLLVTSAKSSSAPVAIKTAIIRGRLTELLSKDLLSKQDQDNLFIVGVFSLLDVILGIPLEKIVEKLSLPDAIIEALVQRRGIYGPFISIAEACEKGDFVTLDTLATQNLLDAGFINKCHLDAISWVETLGV